MIIPVPSEAKQYDDATGSEPAVPWQTLANLGLASDGTSLSISVQVDDGEGGVTTADISLTINNLAPAADAGGSYTIEEGNGLSLNASASTDPGNDSLTYSWDLDNDGQYDDATGSEPTVSWATLANLGLPSNGTSLSIGVQVDDGEGGVTTADTSLAINNVAPSADPGGPYTVIEGGTVILDASGSADPGDDIATYQWDFDRDGTFESSGLSVSFKSDHPGTYGIPLRVTDTDGASTDAIAQLVVTKATAVDLGTVAFHQISSVSPETQNLWYQIETSQAGLLTVESVPTTGTAALFLYDTSRTDPPLAVGAGDGSTQRFDYQVQSNEVYLVKVSGTSNDVALTFANLVATAGTEIQVSGTAADDTFEFAPTGSYQITINGVEYHFDDTLYETIVFTGSEGDDTATLTGGAGNEIARFFPDHGTFDGNGFQVTIEEVTTITANGGGGADEAYMYDSPDDDEFIARKGYGKLSGDGFVLETFDFMYNYGYATTRDGGNDVAYMEDAPERDKFKFDWPKAGQFFGKMYGGGVYYNRAKNFEKIEAVMVEGKNTVRLFDSEGNDTFYGQKEESRLVGDGFDVTVSGYNTLAAFASTGNDIAYLEDSDDDDTTRARPHKITLWGSDDADPTYEIMARRFDEYHFEGKHAGYDRAKLHDTALSDYAEASGDSASLYVNNGELDLLYDVAAFEWVKLYGTNNGSQNTVKKEDPLDFTLIYDDPAMWDELP